MMNNSIRLCIALYILLPTTQCMQPPTLLFEHNQKDPTQGGDLFYTLFVALSMLDTYDRNEISGLKIDFAQNGFNYTPNLGDNWWTYYFKNNIWGLPQPNRQRIPDHQKYMIYLRARFDMPPERLHALYKKYINIQDAIINAADYTAHYFFKDHSIIGVYCHAGAHISQKTLLKAVKQQCKQHKKALIFLVSSDYQISTLLKATYGSRLICSPYTLYTSPDEPLASLSKRLLINCLLLAKCTVLIRTSNALSSFVSVCNPHVPVMSLDQEWLEK